MEALRDAINDLYVAFSSYQLREAISFCDCCHSPDDDQLLRSKKLHDLGIDELHEYIWDAMLVWGDEYDFKHFLPRILEILALEERLTNEFVDPAMVLGRLSYGGWAKWTAKEQEAVRRYLSALWLSKLNHEFPRDEYSLPPIEEWLCAVAQAEDLLEPYLVLWESADFPMAHCNLAHLIVTARNELAERQLPDTYWKSRPEQHKQVVDWLLGGTVTKKLESASTGTLPAASAGWVRRALATLDWLPRIT
jgi:hypothetical protein